METRHAVVSTELGEITLVAADESLTGLYFPLHWNKASVSSYGRAVEAHEDVVLSAAAAQLGEYLSGERVTFDLPTATRGEPFQERVWALLKQIPSGSTTTYGAIASQLGDKALAQAVGKAVGQNPLCIIVPCHRVIGANGKLTGYAGGLANKASLLELEKPMEQRTQMPFPIFA
jgi:methylated-DNA-[protein]-cysteine S-methyltransferase